MALDPNSVIGQISNIYQTISTYFGALSTYLNFGVTPVDKSPLADLNYDELHRFTLTGKEFGADFRVGLAIEAISHSFALSRELDIASLNKAQIYADAAAEASEDADYYSTTQAYSISVMNGVKSDGSQS